jgi:hypothetical protein
MWQVGRAGRGARVIDGSAVVAGSAARTQQGSEVAGLRGIGGFESSGETTTYTLDYTLDHQPGCVQVLLATARDQVESVHRTWKSDHDQMAANDDHGLTGLQRTRI